MKPLRVDRPRLAGDMETLSTFGRNAGGGIDRASFSTADAEARAWLAGRCGDAGLSVREDGVGNVFIRLDARHAGDTAPVWTGSHLDAVPDGGRFDGAAGVIAAVEVLRRLREERVPLARPVEALAWADEEGCYQGLLGSTAVTEGLTATDLDRIVGRNGRSLRQALADSGRDPTAAVAARLPAGAAHAYLELHIEQGPRLEAARADVGVVTAIVGLAQGQATFLGRADHAGTTPMDRRCDALRAAAAFVLRVARLPADLGRRHAVATCGDVAVHPGAANVVPERATCLLDFRDPEAEGVAALEAAIVDAAQACAEDHGVRAEFRRDQLAAPVPMDPGLRALLARCADALGYHRRDLPSLAGHDAQKIAAIAPAAMVFVPSRDGRSHSPAEHTDPEALARGADVLLGAVRALATSS